MGGVDEFFQFIRRAIGGIWRIGEHTVIPPVMAAGKIGDRHKFDRSDAEGGQARQMSCDALKAAESSGVQFVDHGFMPGPALPTGISPGMGMADDHTVTMNIPVLRLRGRIRSHKTGIEAITITCSSAYRERNTEKSRIVPYHRKYAAARDGDRDGFGLRGPKAELRGIRRKQVRAEKTCAHRLTAAARRTEQSYD